MTDKEKNIDPDEIDGAVVENCVDPQARPLASTPVDIKQLGLNQIAYVRQATVDDALVWTIFSAAGTPMGAAENLDQAWGAVMQHGLEPMHVH